MPKKNLRGLGQSAPITTQRRRLLLKQQCDQFEYPDQGSNRTLNIWPVVILNDLEKYQ